MIYLDHAATTPICEAAKKAIIEHLDDYGNPSSSHELGHKALMLIEDARERIAKCINAEPDEIYFTSGGSEANSWALDRQNSLSTPIEHHAIKATFNDIPIQSNGYVDINQAKEIIEHMSIYGKVIQKDCMRYSYARTSLISCMAVNNEIGTVEPIDKLARIAHDNRVLFHTDAVQAIGHIPIDVKHLDVDMLSASGHKFGSPKGVGFLYVKNDIHMYPLIHGGKQERSVRGGTENVLGIISMAAALEDSVEHMQERYEHIYRLRGKLLHRLLSMKEVHLNGSYEDRVASNINVRIDGVKGEDVVAMCDQYGICISAGSACNEGTATPSHVLKAIGLTDEQALSSIRITLGHENTMDEIYYVIEMLPKIIKRLREINA